MSNLQTHHIVPQSESKDPEFSQMVDTVLREGRGAKEIKEYLARESGAGAEEVRGHLDAEFASDVLERQATAKISDFENLLPENLHFVKSVHQNNPTPETLHIVEKILPKVEILKAQKEDYEGAIDQRKERLVGPIVKIFSNVSEFDPTSFGSSSEKTIDNLLESYLLIQGEMSIVLPQEEILKQSAGGGDQTKTHEFKELFSQNEALERVEDKATEMGLALRQLLLKFVSEQDFNEVIEKSENLKNILDKCLNEILTQAANKEMVKIWSEKSNYNLDDLNLAVKEILDAEINKYDFIGDFLEAFKTEKEVFEINKVGGLNIEKVSESNPTSHRTEILEPVPQSHLAHGYEPLAEGIEKASREKKGIKTGIKIIKNALGIFKRKK